MRTDRAEALHNAANNLPRMARKRSYRPVSLTRRMPAMLMGLTSLSAGVGILATLAFD